MKVHRLTFNPLLAALLMSLCLWPGSGCRPGDSGSNTQRPTLMVFAAASLTDVLEELGEAFEQSSGIQIDFNFAGSNVLARQIVAAPKADVFISASEHWMDEVGKAGRIRDGSRRAILSNTLVVIGHWGSEWTVSVPADLCSAEFDHLALGDPQSVPAGRYARQWLESIPCNNATLWETVSGRVSPAPDVRAAMGQVESLPGVLGIVYRTDYLVARDRVKLLYQVSVEEGPAIQYSAAVLQESAFPSESKLFLEFLVSDAAAVVFEDHGFTPGTQSIPDEVPR